MCSSKVLVMPVMKRRQLQNFIFLWKMWSNLSNGFVLSMEEIGLQRNTRCELHFEKKHWRQDERCTLQLSVNPVPTVYPQKLLSKPSSLPTTNYSQSLQKKILPRWIFNISTTLYNNNLWRFNQLHQVFSLEN